MKAAIFVLLSGLFLSNAAGADRPARGQSKGMELYSWSEQGKWVFVLLPGTNRLKSEEEVKKSPDRIETLALLRTRFIALAEGEHVVWNFHFVPGFTFPDQATYAQIIAAAKAAQINLIPDQRE